MMAITYSARRHDREVIAHLLRTPCGGVLGDPGTGKTGQILSTFHVLKKKRMVDHLLIVAPLNPCYEAWPDENRKWNFNFTYQILHGNERNHLVSADIYIINYDGLAWLAQNIAQLMDVAAGGRWWLVFDESTKIKHTNTQRFKMLRPLLPKFPRRTILTGTPSPNGLMDLFGQVYAVDLGERLGRYVTQYRREFFSPTGYGGYTWVLQERAEEKIYERLDGIFYRVDEKVLDLPPIHDVPLYVTLPPKARKVYQDLETEFVAEIRDRIVTAVNAGVLSSKLRQVANGSLYSTEHEPTEVHDEKIAALNDLVEQLQGNPLLVGFEFTADGRRIEKAMRKAKVAVGRVDGSVSMRDRKTLFEAFNRGQLQVLACQSDSAAHGLNLQARCHTVALFGLSWNLETYQQFKKRVHRGGQQKTCTVHHVIARNTIEELQWGALRKKACSQATLLTAIKKRYL